MPYENPWQWNRQQVEWDPNAPHQSPWDVTFEQVNPGYISGMMQLRQRVRAGQASEAERAEYAQMEAAARAIPMRDPSSLQFGWNNDEVGSWNEGGSDWWKMINGSSPDLGPVMLNIADRIDQGTATPHERELFQQTMAYDTDWSYKASVPQASDANPFGLGDNLMGALMMLSIGATGGLAAAPLAAGAGLTLSSAGGLLATAGGITGMLAEPLDSDALKLAGLSMSAAGGVTSLASLLSNGLNSVGDVVKAVQKVYGTSQKAMNLINAAQSAGTNPEALRAAQQASQERQVGSRSQRSSDGTMHAGGSATFDERGGGMDTNQLGGILSGIVGAIGTGLSMADAGRYMEQLKAVYGKEENIRKMIDDAYALAAARYDVYYAQTQEEYQQKQAAYQKAQERYETHYQDTRQEQQQKQAAYQERRGQTTEDRARQIQTWQEERGKVDQNFNARAAQAQQERDLQLSTFGTNREQTMANYNKRMAEAEQDRATEYRTFDENWRRHLESSDRQVAESQEERAMDKAGYQARHDIGANLRDPAALKAGAEALYQPLSELARGRISQNAQAEMASRGVTGGGMYANRLSAEAFAPHEQALWNTALQGFLSGQTGALSAYGNQDLASSPAYREMNAPNFTNSPQWNNIEVPNLQGLPAYTAQNTPDFLRTSANDVPGTVGNPEQPKVPGAYNPAAGPTLDKQVPKPYSPGGNQGSTADLMSNITKLLSGGGGGTNAAAAAINLIKSFFSGGGNNTDYGPAYGDNYNAWEYGITNPQAEPYDDWSWNAGDYDQDWSDYDLDLSMLS